MNLKNYLKSMIRNKNNLNYLSQLFNKINLNSKNNYKIKLIKSNSINNKYK